MSDTLEVRNGAIAVSVIIPVYNEEAVLTRFFDRLYPVLDGLGVGYEAVFVVDGSRDRSATLLRQQYKMRPDATRVVYLRRNAGQYPAIMTGFAASVGRRVVTLDADLQNPPEEIPRLLAEMDQGHDYVGSIRRHRHDARWRYIASSLMNRLRERITRIHMTDQGCMLRAYDRDIVDAVLASNEVNAFIPALAYLYSTNPAEILVGHEARSAGESKYFPYRSIHRHLETLTGFSLAPLQVFSLVGIALALASCGLGGYLLLRWVMIGSEADGVVTLLGVLFLLAGAILFGMGLLGAYVGRLLDQSRGRPRDLVCEELIPRPATGSKGHPSGGQARPGSKA